MPLQRKVVSDRIFQERLTRAQRARSRAGSICMINSSISIGRSWILVGRDLLRVDVALVLLTSDAVLLDIKLEVEVEVEVEGGEVSTSTRVKDEIAPASDETRASRRAAVLVLPLL